MKGAHCTPNISEKGELLSARIAMAVAIGVATYLGLNPPGFAAQTVALAFGLAAASIFPALMMGIFSKRVNNKGAVAGMLAGIIWSPCVYIFLHKGWLFIPGTNSFTDAGAAAGHHQIHSRSVRLVQRSTSRSAIFVSNADRGAAAGDPGAGRERPRPPRRQVRPSGH